MNSLLLVVLEFADHRWRDGKKVSMDSRAVGGTQAGKISNIKMVQAI